MSMHVLDLTVNRHLLHDISPALSANVAEQPFADDKVISSRLSRPSQPHPSIQSQPSNAEARRLSPSPALVCSLWNAAHPDQPSTPFLQTLPTHRELLAARRGDLVRAIKMHGGSAAVAARLGLRYHHGNLRCRRLPSADPSTMVYIVDDVTSWYVEAHREACAEH
jgi:hypothetical protein